MKKKIIFMLINMNIGGTEKALLNMLSEIPNEKYEVTLLLLEEFGGFLNSIPKNVQIEYLKGYKKIKKNLNHSPQQIVQGLLKSGNILKACKVTFLYVLTKILKDSSIYLRSIVKEIDSLEKEYDIAVAYAGPMDFISYFVINKIKSKKKVQWIHFDVTKIGFNKRFAARIYGKFDQIFVVSKDGRNKLVSLIPGIKEKTDTFFNLILPESLEKLANEGTGFKDDFKGIRILTVGRLTKEKGQDLTIHVLAKLKRDGYNVRWYCIGDGNARNEYEGLIKKFGLEEDFVLLGTYPNPYPFMKQCDIYVQPSRHEGYCITLSEARYFHKPIISTNFTGASEQIIDKETGLIVNYNDREMFSALKQLLDYPNLKEKLEKNTSLSGKEAKQDIRKLLNM
jgi:glycosyltransferase involved in cell wall biosynthesis